MNHLVIKNLNVNIQNKKILNNLNIFLKTGEMLAIVGPNGAGKSTILKTLMHHFNYHVKHGSIKFNNQDLLKLSTDQISQLGFFYAFQNPTELPGVQNLEFLKLVANHDEKNKVQFYDLYSNIQKNIKKLELPDEILTRNVNVGFSGGQKKKNEILQALLFKPSVLLLDEIDSGLDIDAMDNISKYINENKKNMITIIVSHHIEFLNVLKPNKVLVLVDGEIAKTGNLSLINEIEKKGYKQFTKSIKPKKDFEITDPYLVCHKK